jgi:ferrous iron transport protein B
MLLVYVVTFVLGKYPQDWLASGFTYLHDQAADRLPAGELSSLLVDGIIPGVGAVVVFVPVIMILMGCISFLEDTGYMARAAFIMDRLMHLMGLHGRSFIPLIMGTGCNVPALQATRIAPSRSSSPRSSRARPASRSTSSLPGPSSRRSARPSPSSPCTYSASASPWWWARDCG